MRRHAAMLLLAVAAFVALGVTLFAFVAHAQDAPHVDAATTVPDVTLPEVGETFDLELNQRAPWAGMLVRDEDLFGLQTALQSAQFQLANARSMYAESVSGRASLLAAAESTCAERITLHDSLWRERRDEVLAALAASRAREGAQWYEILEYGFVGLVVGALVGVAIGFGLHP